MLPCNPGGHAAFQDTFVSQFLKFYPDPFVLPKSTWDYIVQFWYLDLSQTDSIMQECYSVFGPEPRLPSCMLRSYLLALKLKVTSVTVWCRMLRETPLYAILSGFSFGDTPGVGTFYDKREKEDYKLEDGRRRSTKMWHCRLYGIMMLQHLDAWKMPSAEAFQKSFLGLAA